jgi:hypothetical protein
VVALARAPNHLEAAEIQQPSGQTDPHVRITSIARSAGQR